MGKNDSGKNDSGKDAKGGKGDLVKWTAKLAKNDAEHGRDSKSNPNNKPNGK